MLKQQSAANSQQSAKERDSRFGTVVRKNGKIFKDRVCPVCEAKHWHGSKTCITCENSQHKKRYGSWYTKKQKSPGEKIRQKKLKEHTRRIRARVKEIEAAGFSIDEHVYEDVEEVLAGQLDADKARKAVKI